MNTLSDLPSLKSTVSSRAANAAGIASALGLLASEAAAQVTLLTPDPSPFTDSGTGDDIVSLSFDPDSNAASTGTGENIVLFARSANENITLLNFSGNLEYVYHTENANGRDINLLSLNDSISVGDMMAFSGSGCGPTVDLSGLTDGDSFFFAYGFRSSGSEDSYNYGWAELSFSYAGATNTLGINQWAYNTTAGQGLLAGTTTAVPEPASVATALGFVAIAAAVWKRRRQHSAAA